MTVETFVSQFGYWAVLAGSAVEGETILALGGLAAHRGYLDLKWVIAVAFASTLVADQAFFHLGRRYGKALLARRPSWRSKVAGVLGLLERYEILVILGFRFAYGLRVVSPFAIGLSDVAAPRFVALNVVGAAVWATVVATAGYLLGEVLESILGDLRRYEESVFLAVAVLGAVLWAIHRVRGRRT